MRFGLLLLAAGVAACAPAGPMSDANVLIATEPQYAPGDPCKGVVPQLCPR